MCKSCIPRIPTDMGKAEAFAGQMIQTINAGALSAMISIGHRCRLFDVMAAMEAADSKTIAENAGLNERYVREWLGAMVSGRIINYEPKNQTYELPAEHALFLTRQAKEKNMAAITSMLPVWSKVEDQIVECFEKGGGVPYEQYGRFHEVMGEISQASVGENLTELVLPNFPELEARLKEGIQVLDIGCGDGQILLTLAQAFPNSRFLGIDLCEEPIAGAQARAAELGLKNLWYEARDLLDFKTIQNFDLITAFDVIHDLAFPDKVLSLVHSWLKEDGLFLMMDIHASSYLEKNLDNPFAPFLYTASTLHCMTVSLSQGGMGLGTVWGEEKASEMLLEAGFGNIRIERFEHDLLDSYYFCKK